MSQPAPSDLAVSEPQRPGSASASLKLRRAAGGTLLAPASRELGAWEGPSSRNAPTKKRPPTIDTFDEASAASSTPGSLPSIAASGNRQEKAAQRFDMPSPDVYDVSHRNRTWVLQGKSPPAVGPKVVWPSNVELAQRLGFPTFSSASKVAPAPDALGKPAFAAGSLCGPRGLQVPPVPPSPADHTSQTETQKLAAGADSSHPERRLREAANPMPTSLADAVEAGGSEHEPPHQATPGAQGSLVELPGHGEAALAEVAEYERRHHPVRDAMGSAGSRATDDLWDFLVDWFSIEQFMTPLQYLEMDHERVKDLVEADVEGLHQEALMRQHRPYFSVAQSILALALWLILSVKDYNSNDGDLHWTLVKAGLDSLWPGQTDLRVGLDCEDSRAEVWRWLTYQYTHIGLAHVTMNTLLNLLLGVPLEGFHGTLRTAVMYYVGVFGGACCYFVSDVHHPAVGMSGGCYSLIGMHLGCLLLNWRQKKYRWVKLFFLALLAGADMLNARFAVSNGDVHVSHSIHFGGYIAGVIICLIIGRNLVVKRWEQVLCVVALLTGICCVSFCMAWGMSWPPQTIFERVRWCWTRQVFNPQIFGDREWHCVRCTDQACIDKWLRQKWIADVSTWACDRRGGWAVTER